MKHILAYLVFVATRLGIALVTIFGVATLVFFGMRLIPGNYADLFFPLASDVDLAAIEAEYGLDKSAFQQ